MEALKLIGSDVSGDLDEINRTLAARSAADCIQWAAAQFGEGLVMTSSFGAHSALMLHLVSRFAPSTRVIFLDTGYLFPETYQFAEMLRERFKLRLEVYAPNMTAARQEALYGRRWDGAEEELKAYQAQNKVEPLKRALKELGACAWLAGLRAEQTTFRSGLRRVERQNGLLKLHPILNWTKSDVERYFETHELPYHPLYAFGYRSIGDAHSTVPVPVGEDDRSGRYLGAKRECGIHLGASEEEDASHKSSSL